MNTLTQQQINQYQWQVADGMARPVNTYQKNSANGEYDIMLLSKPPISNAWYLFEQLAKELTVFTNAPDGIYSGEAFEEPVWQWSSNHGKDWADSDIENYYKDFKDFAYQNRHLKTRQFLRLKPSHLPAVLTTQPGEEWKDRYREVWFVQDRGNLDWTKVTRQAIYDNYNFERYAALQFDIQDQTTKREWHLKTPPAKQESETALDVLKRTNYIVPADEANCVAETILHDEVGMVTYAMLEYADAVTKQLQFTLTQKDQRIAELEREWISVCTRLPDLIEGKDYSENVFAVVDGKMEVMCLTIVPTDNGDDVQYGYCWANCFGNINGDAEFDDEYDVTHWKHIDRTLPTPPQH